MDPTISIEEYFIGYSISSDSKQFFEENFKIKNKNIVVEESGLSRMVWDHEQRGFKSHLLY